MKKVFPPMDDSPWAGFRRELVTLVTYSPGEPPPDLNRWKPARAGQSRRAVFPVTPSTASLLDMQHSFQEYRASDAF